jgi:uncharacterized protein
VRRLLISIVLFFVALALVGLAAVGWIFSSSILNVEPYSLQPEFIITDVTETTVILPEPPSDRQFANTRREGVYNLRWGTAQGETTGYGRLGKIISDADGKIVRELSLTSGVMPKAGDSARLESFVFLRNPKEDLGIDYEEVKLTSDAGELRTWWIDQKADTAVIMVHGRRRGTIQETLRAMPTVVSEGYSLLAMAYRNHGDSALSPDGFFHYGESEWQDVIVALDFLESKGVKNVILYAFSMGAEVMLETFERYKTGLNIKAIILDAPFLDPRTIFQNSAKRMNLPVSNFITNWAMVVARWRSGINWQSLDQRSLAPSINVPVLLFAGTGDTTIPIALVDEFASKVPDIEYHRLGDVEHVESWNYNPEQYQTWLREFLQKVRP